jgi:hypothetical protein
VVNLRLSLEFGDLSSEKCLEKCCEFSRFGWQLPSPVANFVKVESHFRLKLADSHLAVP